VPFFRTHADGPVIQQAMGALLCSTASAWPRFWNVGQFRESNQTTPVVLDGVYLNPVSYGL